MSGAASTPGSTASFSAATAGASSTVPSRDLLPAAREIVGDRAELYLSGGLRRGTDLLKAIALGARAVLAGRAPLYGLCAAGAPGARRALEILEKEALDAMGLLGARTVGELGARFLAPPAGAVESRSGEARAMASAA